MNGPQIGRLAGSVCSGLSDSAQMRSRGTAPHRCARVYVEVVLARPTTPEVRASSDAIRAARRVLGRASDACGRTTLVRSRMSPPTTVKYSSPWSRYLASRSTSRRWRSPSLWSDPSYSPDQSRTRIEQIRDSRAAVPSSVKTGTLHSGGASPASRTQISLISVSMRRAAVVDGQCQCLAHERHASPSRPAARRTRLIRPTEISQAAAAMSMQTTAYRTFRACRMTSKRARCVVVHQMPRPRSLRGVRSVPR